MTRIVLPIALLTTTLALSLPAAATSLIRTFVSPPGNDPNPGTVTQPCRPFAAAYTATAAGGIVTALDPAGYGPLTITGSITIDGNGWAAITSPGSGNGIGIFVASGSTDAVFLRGLIVDGGNNPNTTGIDFATRRALTIDDCVLRNMALNRPPCATHRAAPPALIVARSSFCVRR